MHRYRSHTCGALREGDVGQTVRLSGWCHRIRDHGGVLFIDLRDHYGITQVVADPDSPAFALAEKLRSEWVVRIDGKVRNRPEGTVNPDLPTGQVEVYIDEIEVLGPAAELPMPVFGEQDYPEDIRLKYRFLDLRREHLHNNIMLRGARDRLDPHPHEGRRLLRIPDADPDRVVAGRRARLPGAVAPASRQVLRAAAGAAAVQAAADGGGLRPLFPDRAVLPRRGRARRPLARRVLPARPRDELRHAGGRVRRGRAGDARRVRGIRRRQAGDAEVPAHPLCRSDLEIRHRQARPAQPDRDAGRQRGVPRLRLQDLRAHPGDRGQRGVGDSRAQGRQPRLLRPHEFLGARRGPARPRLHLLARGRGERRRAARPRTSAPSAPSRSPISSASASATRASSSPAGRRISSSSPARRARRSARNSA